MSGKISALVIIICNLTLFLELQELCFSAFPRNTEVYKLNFNWNIRLKGRDSTACELPINCQVKMSYGRQHCNVKPFVLLIYLLFKYVTIIFEVYLPKNHVANFRRFLP